MLGQKAGWIAASSDDVFSYSKTIQVSDRTTRMEMALTHVHEYAQIGITQIVSDSGVEELGYKAVAFRDGVTSVTFSVLVFDSGATARWMLHYWS